MSSINVTRESASYSELEGISESAILRSGDRLSIYSRQLVSTNGKYSLVFNGDGGGFIRVVSSHGLVWISHPECLDPDLCFPSAMPDDVLVMEESVNLIFYEQMLNSRVLAWQSNTTGEGNFLVLKDDGKLVIYDRNNQQIWSSHTNNSS